MSPWSKLFTAAGVLLLLGLGLCGADALHPTTTHAVAVSDAAFFGFVLCAFAVLVLIIGSIRLAATQDPTGSQKKPRNKP